MAENILDLKTVSVWAFLTCKGRLFQSLGPATVNARSPLLFNLTRGTTNNKWSADLSPLDGAYGCIRSERYVGARPFNDLKTKIKILKSILNEQEANEKRPKWE